MPLNPITYLLILIAPENAIFHNFGSARSRSHPAFAARIKSFRFIYLRRSLAKSGAEIEWIILMWRWICKNQFQACRTTFRGANTIHLLFSHEFFFVICESAQSWITFWMVRWFESRRFETSWSSLFIFKSDVMATKIELFQERQNLDGSSRTVTRLKWNHARVQETGQCRKLPFMTGNYNDTLCANYCRYTCNAELQVCAQCHR